MKNISIRSYLIIAISAISIISISLIGFVCYFPISKHDFTIDVKKGDGEIKICKKITQNNPLGFVACLLFRLYSSTLKKNIIAGVYNFGANASIFDVANGIRVAEMFEIFFPEGITSYEIREILNADPNTVGYITEELPEGVFMPDTYRFAKGVEKITVLNAMSDAMVKFLKQEWSKRDMDIFIKTPREAIVVASIVDTEAAISEERSKIASVLYNRLKRPQRLQSCATIVYCKTNKKFARTKLKISSKDLWIDCKHNTYRKDGLPPTPICCPSRDSILAALHPAKTRYLYFVANKKGGHFFLSSFADHIEQKFKTKKNIK